MAGRGELTQRVDALPALQHGSALRALPKRQAYWIGAQAIAAAALTGLWAGHPELALCLAMGTGVVAVNPRKAWSLPLVAALVTVAGMGAAALELSAVIGAGAAAGALASWLLPEPTDWLDHIHGALGTLAGSSIGLWLAALLIPESLPALVSIALTATLVGTFGSLGLVPLAFRFDHPTLPSRQAVNRMLRPAYRPAVYKAFELYEACAANAPDTATRRGMIEVATWVLRLQKTQQTLDVELDAVDPAGIQERIERCETDEVEDPFTQERRHATAEHLKRLLAHRQTIETEHRRNGALVDYALAFLEEARAALAVARQLPGDEMPDRLNEVLERLRREAQTGDARRRTVRELGRLHA